MSNDADRQEPGRADRADHRDAARAVAREAAEQRREERRHGAVVRAYRPRWRYYDAVHAARELGGAGPS
jgi:hypothetical protein